MTEERIKEIEELCHNANSGYWIYANSPSREYSYVIAVKNGPWVAGTDESTNADFIAQSHQIIPELLAEVKLLKEVVNGK